MPASGTRGSCRARSIVAALLVALTVCAIALATRAPVALGQPGVPAAPQRLYEENFQNGSGVTLLPEYVPSPPHSDLRYAADSYWLNTYRCNGFILDFKDAWPGTTFCNTEGNWNHVRAKTYALGLLNDPQNPETNRAVSSNTSGAADNNVAGEPDGPITPNEIKFATKGQLTLPRASGRFVTFSVNAAATACAPDPTQPNRVQPQLRFFLRDALGVEHPVSDQSINPCTSPGHHTRIVSGTTTTGASWQTEVSYGDFAADSSILLAGDSLGIVLRGEAAHSSGNDGAFDNIEVLDVTPSLYKSFDPQAVKAGDTSRLTFTVTNTSELAAKPGWSFTDHLPAGLTIASPGNASSDCPGAQVTAPGGGSTVSVTGNLDADQASCTVSVDVTSPVEGTFTNGPDDVSIHGLNPPPPATVEFGPAADLSIHKHASVATIHEGEDFDYSLTVHNHGPSTAQDATVTDAIPDGIHVRSVTTSRGSCSQAPPVVCSLGDLAVGHTVTIMIHVTAHVHGAIVNTAVVVSPTPDPDPSNNEGSTSVHATQSADLQIVKHTSAAAVLVGQSFTFRLTVTNHGPSRAEGVAVTDRIPDGMVLDRATSTHGQCAGAPVVVCELGDLGRGDTATIRLTVTAHQTSTHFNGASVTSETLDPDGENNTDNTGVDVGEEADLQIVKTASVPTAHVGETVTYAVVVTNHGPHAAADVTVTDPVPPDARIVSVAPSTGHCHVGAAIVCRIGALPRGASARIEIRVVFEQPGSTRDAASVVSSTPDPDTSNNTAETAHTAVKADLQVTKTSSHHQVALGGHVTYTIVVANHGTGTATGVFTTDPISPGIDVHSATPTAGSCSLVDHTLECSLGDIVSGQRVTITVVATAVREGQIHNEVSVIAASPTDPDVSDNVDDATVHVGRPRAMIAVSKHASRRLARTGDRVGYRIVVGNTSTRTADHVRVCDRLPLGLSYARARGARLHDGRACWTIARLAPHTANTRRLTAVVQAGPAARLTNVVTVTAANARTRHARATIRRVAAPRTRVPTPVTG